MTDRKMAETENPGSEGKKFFVLVPVYRVEKYIRACIDSVRNQTYQNFELVLVDDGSPDDSGRICDEYASVDNRIAVIHQDNKGLIAARQTAVRYVRQRLPWKLGDSFIIFLDSDDSLKKDALERICWSFLEYGCDMVVYGMDRVADGKVVTPYHVRCDREEILSDKRLLYRRVFGSAEYNPLCRKAISSQLLSEEQYSEFYHISHAEDLLQSIAYYKKCGKVCFLEESLYDYTINPESITQTVSEKNFRVDFTVRQKVMEFLLMEDVFNDEDWGEYRACCIRFLCGSLKNILQFPVSWKRKWKWFEEIWDSDYFKRYIQGEEYTEESLGRLKYLYRLYSKKVYWPILFCVGSILRVLRTAKSKTVKG